MSTELVHAVMFSGGIGSWAAAARVRARFPEDRILAVFADTCMEDEDLYRFLPEAAASVGADLVTLRDGRTPWDVFRDERFLGNSRVDPCSKILKRQMLDRWQGENLDPASSIVYLGIDWTEEHRFRRVRERLAGWRVEAPMCEPPFISKLDMLAALRSAGIEPPRLYAMGFSRPAAASHPEGVPRARPGGRAVRPLRLGRVRVLRGSGRNLTTGVSWTRRREAEGSGSTEEW